jgi:hypothetical protein
VSLQTFEECGIACCHMICVARQDMQVQEEDERTVCDCWSQAVQRVSPCGPFEDFMSYADTIQARSLTVFGLLSDYYRLTVGFSMDYSIPLDAPRVIV